MEEKWAEERRCRLEMERKLEEERKLREEQSAMMQSMVTWMQGLGASLNYATPPPPFALPAQPYLPQGPSSTPVSMQNQFVCFYLYLCYSYSIYVFLFAESVVERIERPSSGPELAGGPVANLANLPPPDRE